MTISDHLSKFVARTTFESLPPEAVVQAKRAILDTLGVALAGCHEEGPSILADQTRTKGGAPEAALLGWPHRAPAADAALVNGTSTHALDFDDVNVSMRGHPSAPLLPSGLAVAEMTGNTGAELLLAFTLGMEVETKLGRMMGGRHYTLGWHATSTLGTIGATAVCAKLMGLDDDRTRTALGIAASMASGIRANFGTMTKPLHVGLAARNGVQAAALVAAGFTASDHAMDADDGFVAAFLGDPQQRELLLDGLGQPYDIVSPGIAQKLYPCCYATHRTVDAAIEMASGIDAAEITSVSIHVSRGTLMPLIDHRPRTGLEGKFSLPYCTAAALLDGDVRMSSFTDETVGRPQVSHLLDVTEVIEDREAQSNPLAGWSELRVALADGGDRSIRVDIPKGDPRRPLTWDDLAAKFRDCSAPYLGPSEADRIIDAVERLDDLDDVRSLAIALATEEAEAT